MSQAKSERSKVQSVMRASKLLNQIARKGGGTSQELGNAVGIDRTVVHRLLKTFESDELVVQIGSRWELGPGLLVFGMAYLEQHPFPATARPYGIDLQRRIVGDRPWVVSLGMPVMDQVVLVEQFWGPSSPLDIIHSVGKRLSMAQSGTGLAFLSSMCESEAIARVGKNIYEELFPHLEKIRLDSGLAFSKGIVSSGVGVVATTVQDASGRPIGSVNISGIDLDDELFVDSNISLALLRTAQSISAVL